MEIAIIGCGIGGLASACLLRDQGHDITIFDEFAAPKPVGAGLILQPVTRPVLADLGILGACLKHGVKIKALSGRNMHTDRVALSARYDVMGKERFGLSIQRGALFSLLLNAARARQIKIAPNNLVLGVQDINDPYLRIEGGRQAGPFDLIVDASGIHSQVSPNLAVPLSFGALWTVVDLPEDDAELGNLLRQRYVHASKMAGVMPLGTLPEDPTPKAALFWSLKRKDYDIWRNADIADWKAEAAELWPDFGYLLDQVKSHDQVTYSRYGHGSLTKLYRGKVVFVGDAAHRTSPQLGQGANMALLDAFVLADALAEGPVDVALARFSRRRLLHVKSYQLMSALFTPLYQSDRKIYAHIRDRVLTPLTRTKPIDAFVSKIICGDVINPYSGSSRDISEASRVRDILRDPGE